MDITLSSSSASPGAANSQGNVTKGPGQWFSMRRILRDFRRLGSRRQSHKLSGGRNREEAVTVNSSSFYLDEDEASRADDTSAVLIECPVCTFMQPPSSFPVFLNVSCRHRTCVDCMRCYLTVEVNESRTDVACPVCSARIHPDDIRRFLSSDYSLLMKYEEFSLRRALVVDPDVRWCPAPDCGYAVIATGCASCPKLRCERPGCGTLFCYHCKQVWHPNLTCAAARAKRLSGVQSSSSINCSVESTCDNAMLQEVKGCPRCGALIVKMDDGSCNHMTCTICAAEFCWLCMQEISDIHYLSPSGCTFWGKKQWSRKKKILLQLGMLVGGPVGIALIAVAAVPAIVIGLPFWAASKLHKKLSKVSRHRRNAAVFGGVLASIVVAPVLSVIVVVVGVPLLLAYVYGVVPVSLCRSISNCGIKATSAGGVRINFDEDSDYPFPTQGGSVVGPFLSSTNIATEREVSLGALASYDVASESRLETAGVQADSEHFTFNRPRMKLTAGSFCNQLEVHAEVTSRGVVSPRGSLGDGMSSMHGVAKARSTATVSFSDIISTSQDVSSSNIFQSPPSETSLDSETSTVLRSSGRSASVTSSGMSAYLPRSAIQPGAYILASPPLTKRSVSFVRDLGKISSTEQCDGSGMSGARRSVIANGRVGVSTSSWTYKRQCMSVGDSIDERVESAAANTDYLSIRSLATPAAVAASAATAKLEPCSGGSDIVAMIAAVGSAEVNCPSSASALPRAAGYHCLAPTNSVDASDCLSDCSNGSNFGLTTAESVYGLHHAFTVDQYRHMISANSINEM